MLALNLVERSPGQLLGPLDWNQGAPAGFLLAREVLADAVRHGGMVVSARAVRRIGAGSDRLRVDRAAAPSRGSRASLAMALFAVSPFLISYAGECKQYASDAALSVAMFSASVGLLRRSGRLAPLGGPGRGGGRGGVVLASRRVRPRRNRHRVVPRGACREGPPPGRCVPRRRSPAGWRASASAISPASKQLGNNQFLIDYWAGHFLPLPPTSQGDLMWLADHFFEFLAYPGGLGGTEIAIGGHRRGVLP